MKPAVLYARVSTKEQEEEGYSIPAQIRLLEDYAKRNGFEIVKQFVEAESAKKAGRKAFKSIYLSKNCTISLEQTNRVAFA